jgi:hypothetical protein
MKFLARTVWVSQVLLTAAMLLFTGLPHSLCRCPDGRIKLFCLGSASSATACCCAGACCSSSSGQGCCAGGTVASAQPASKGSCCHGAPEQHDRRSGPGSPQVSPPGCQKTLVHSDLLAVPTLKPEVGQHTPVAQFLPPLLSFLPFSPPSVGLAGCWSYERLPPPTDKVITLQHFLI